MPHRPWPHHRTQRTMRARLRRWPSAMQSSAAASSSAAVNGLGIALESTRLAERGLANGQLVQIVARQAVEIRYIGHFLVFPRFAVRRQTLQVFIKWISKGLGLDFAQSTQAPD
jgi:DNA-binding transcriptional LysR family regulator